MCFISAYRNPNSKVKKSESFILYRNCNKSKAVKSVEKKEGVDSKV